MANANNKKKYSRRGARARRAANKVTSQITDSIKGTADDIKNSATNIVPRGGRGGVTAKKRRAAKLNETTADKRAHMIAEDPPKFVCPELDEFNKNLKVGDRNRSNLPGTKRKRAELKAACKKRAAAPNRPSRMTIVPPDGDGTHLIDNVLNDYIGVQYHITLSMLSEHAASDVQAHIPLNVYNAEVKEDLRQELKRQGAIVLASTGDQQRQELEDLDTSSIARKPVATEQAQLQNSIQQALDVAQFDPNRFSVGADPFAIESDIDPNNSLGAALLNNRSYYNIKAMTMENALSPSSVDTYISTMMALNMTIVEPNGFRFVDDLRALRCILGWENVNTNNVMYRIDVKWSGYNPTTGEWVSSIPLNARKANRKSNLTYYVVITNMEGNVTPTGTEYKISLAPSGVSVFSGTDFSMDASHVFTGTQNTFGGFTDNLATLLNNRKKQNTAEGVEGSSGLEREFEFIMPNQLREATFYANLFAVNQSYLDENKDKGGVVQMGRNADLITMLRAALSDTQHVQESFISNTGDGTNDDFIKPRVHYTFRFNTIYGKEKVPNVHAYKSVKIQVIIEPFVTFRKGSVTPESLADYVKPESQTRRIEAMQNQGMIIRKYDYLNTSGNTEVIDLDLNFSAFYLESLKRNQDWPGVKGLGTSNTTSDKETRNNDISNRANLQVQVTTNPDKQQSGSLLVAEEDKTAIQRLFSGRTGAASTTQLNSICNPNQVFGGGFEVTRDQDSFGAISSDGDTDGRKDQYVRELLDYVANDFLQIDSLKVRGDPVWMFTPYGNEIIDLISLQNPETGDIITPTGDKIIFLDVRRANQNDIMNPDRNIPTTADPSYIGGFYNVTKVISSFEGGIFTQAITAAKLNHLNFAESLIGLDAFNNQDTSNVVVTNQDITEPHPVDFDSTGSRVLDQKLNGTRPVSVFSQAEDRANAALDTFDSATNPTNVFDRFNGRFNGF